VCVCVCWLWCMNSMANIAVQRIKREFKEVLKSEEVRSALTHTCVHLL